MLENWCLRVFCYSTERRHENDKIRRRVPYSEKN